MSLIKTFSFLEQIRDNNNREWFNKHKPTYQEAQSEVKYFAENLYEEMSQHDTLDEGAIKVFRLFRDVRFGKDKTPFKTHWSGGYRRTGEERRGGYYFSLEPGNSFVGGGFFGPNPQDLLHMRKQISQDPEPFRGILKSKKFMKTFGQLQGDQVKTTPKGFDKNDPAIDLLRYKQMIVRHRFTDEEALDKDFVQKVSEVYAEMRPFLDYMTDILTTDLNGVSLIDR